MLRGPGQVSRCRSSRCNGRFFFDLCWSQGEYQNVPNTIQIHLLHKYTWSNMILRCLETSGDAEEAMAGCINMHLCNCYLSMHFVISSIWCIYCSRAAFSGLQNRCWVRWEAPKCERSCCNSNKCRYFRSEEMTMVSGTKSIKMLHLHLRYLCLCVKLASGLYPDLSEMHGMHGMRCPKWKARIASFIRGSLKGGRCQR